MKDDSKFWEIVDGVEINSKKVKVQTSFLLLITQLSGLILLFVGLIVNPVFGVLGFLIALFGLNKHLSKKNIEIFKLDARSTRSKGENE